MSFWYIIVVDAKFTDPKIYNKLKPDEQASTSEAGRKLRSGVSFFVEKDVD